MRLIRVQKTPSGLVWRRPLKLLEFQCALLCNLLQKSPQSWRKNKNSRQRKSYEILRFLPTRFHFQATTLPSQGLVKSRNASLVQISCFWALWNNLWKACQNFKADLLIYLSVSLCVFLGFSASKRSRPELVNHNRASKFLRSPVIRVHHHAQIPVLAVHHCQSCKSQRLELLSQRYLRYPMKTRQNACDTPLCDTISMQYGGWYLALGH